MILDYLKALYYEFKSQYVAQAVRYKLEGNCIKCGDCCRYMYSIDTYTESEFKFMQKIFPKYRRFEIIGRDDMGNLIFACKLITSEGLCSNYKNRLKMCKKYPGPKINAGGSLHPNCGYRIIPEKSFKDYLKR